MAGLLLLFMLPLLAIALDLLAKKVRDLPAADRMPPRVLTVATSRELWQTYTGLALRGRLLLHISRHLHFVQVPSHELYRLDQGDLSRLDLAAAYLQRVDHRNYLWLAARAGMFRSIHYLLEEDTFREKGAEAGVADGDEFTVYDSGFPRVISLRPPGGSEPPVVHIDAAWLEQHTPEEVVTLLQQLPVRPDIISISAATDDPERTPLARERISRLKELVHANLF
jgi:hypothetical protein